MRCVRTLSALLACGVLLALPAVPLRADVLLAGEAGSRMDGDAEAACGAEAPSVSDEGPAAPGMADAGAPSGERVGSLINEEDWWELPIGALFMGAAAYGIHNFLFRNDSDE